MLKDQLTLENKSKQPRRLMTQYTSGRRGPFPLGCQFEKNEIWITFNSFSDRIIAFCIIVLPFFLKVVTLFSLWWETNYTRSPLFLWQLLYNGDTPAFSQVKPGTITTSASWNLVSFFHGTWSETIQTTHKEDRKRGINSSTILWSNILWWRLLWTSLINMHAESTIYQNP